MQGAWHRIKCLILPLTKGELEGVFLTAEVTPPNFPLVWGGERQLLRLLFPFVLKADEQEVLDLFIAEVN